MISKNFIDEDKIKQLLNKNQKTAISAINEVLLKARELKGLDENDVAMLMQSNSPETDAALFETARFIKDTIYGRRLVLFAPLYISNLCANECLYCAFRANNKEITRRALSQDEISAEIKLLLKEGHKRILLVAGESYPDEGFNYVLKAVDTIYKTRSGIASIRRVNANVAPLTIEQFKELKNTGIGTYQLFQETYHGETYKKVHLSGKKSDYDWRITGFDRAMEAGLGDVGAGVLFGLYDWKFELLAMLQHVRHLEALFGFGPHTISVPRLEPATGSPYATSTDYQVSDSDFKRIIAILRCAVPYTGIILSTRENPDTRRASLALGVSQISAGSRTNPGGYGEGEDDQSGQFSLGDHRSLDEVVQDVAQMGYIPSFCTACYRLGRVGGDFMDLARPGDIKMFCDPNACSTFTEYLEDYATPETKKIGYELINKATNDMNAAQREKADGLMNEVKGGKRDCLC
jgi:2-iminoacetate synthase